MSQDAGRGREWFGFGQDPKLVQEWLRQNNLAYGGLIAIGVALVQPLMTAASLDLSARICVVAFSVAIPLLAGLLVLNRQEVFRGRVTGSVVVESARVVAQMAAFVGLVAGFWHIYWIAGVGMLAGGLLAVAVHSAGYGRLERGQFPAPPAPRTPGTRASRRARSYGPADWPDSQSWRNAFQVSPFMTPFWGRPLACWKRRTAAAVAAS
jgi:hypothetical protein